MSDLSTYMYEAVVLSCAVSNENSFEIPSYEIHTEPSARSLKIGSHLMKVLEILAQKTNLSKVVLTVFKHNPGAKLFFQKLG